MYNVCSSGAALSLHVDHNPELGRVFAKVTGFPYWPAVRVSEEDGGRVQVKFPSTDQHAVINVNNVKPFTKNNFLKFSASVKKTGAHSRNHYSEAWAELLAEEEY
jgi:hypothetical protein